MWRRALFWLLLAGCVVIAARLIDRHSWQFDLTAQQRHSLTDVARQALDQIGPGLEIVAFIPDYPISRAELNTQLGPYLAHPSRPTLRYIDPLTHPDQAEALGMRREGEIQLRLAERREVLAAFATSKVDRALNRLALRGDRWIVHLAVTEAGPIDATPLGLGTLAERATQLGYRMLSLDPRRIDRLPDNTAVLLVRAPDEPLDAHARSMILDFLSQGGRMLWLAGETDDPWLADHLGITRRPGVIVDADAARYGLDSPANAIVEEWPDAVLPLAPSSPAALYRAAALEHTPTNDWSVVGAFRSSARSWNETGALSGRLRRDAEDGERSGPLTVGLALEADQDQTRRVLYLGSRHVFSNAHIGRLGNGEFALGLLRWLTDNTGLVASADAPSYTVHWEPRTGGILGIILMGLLPAAYLGTGLWLRRRRRRQ
jgi:hypothetical protein